MKPSLSVIILTYNEEVHIGRLLDNIADWADEIFIVDSFSTDKTLEIVKKWDQKNSSRKSAFSPRLSATIVQHKFENQAQQFNWALDNLKIKNDWILRLDADEYLTEELKEEILEILQNTNLIQKYENTNINGLNIGTSDIPNINAFYIKRRVYFMGRWIKHGAYYPVWFLRLFRKGKVRSEQRAMDEHIILLEGKAGKLKNDFIDENLKGLTDWTAKHNNYSTREAEAYLNELTTNNQQPTTKMQGQAKRKRWLKNNFYYKLPLFFRVCAYFCYRYFLRLGFLDGKEGLIFHFLHAFWYRFLVDAKIYESKIKKL